MDVNPRVHGAALICLTCIALVAGLVRFQDSVDSQTPEDAPSRTASPALSRADPALQQVQAPTVPSPSSIAHEGVHKGPQIDATEAERAEFLKWFQHTSVCMRRVADLKIRSYTLDKKDLKDEANILEMTDYTATMCGNGLRTFLTKQAGYGIPDADALLDDLAERMVKARVGLTDTVPATPEARPPAPAGVPSQLESTQTMRQ